MKKKKPQIVSLGEEAEFFDLDAISGSDSSPSPRRPFAEKKVIKPPRPRGRPPRPQSKAKPVLALDVGVSRELFDIDEFSADDVAVHDSPPSRRRKATPASGPGNKPADPLVSIPMNVDILAMAPGRSVHTQQTLKRGQKRRSGGRTESEVIEISDD
jgi:hypothetical protein